MATGFRMRFLAGFRLKRWQVLLLILIVFIGAAYSFELSRMAPLWDETVHLVGGFILYQGHFGEYGTFTRYPPLVDFLTAGSYGVFGVSVASARLVSVIFSLLIVVVVFVLASKAYNRKVAFLGSIILATMPGFIYQARFALLDIPLLLFFVASMLLFYSWLKTGKNSTLIIAGLVLGAGVLAKYQAVVAGLVMLAALPWLFYRNKTFKAKISRFPLIGLSVAIIVVPILWWIYQSGIFWQWISLLQNSDMQTNVYSVRFPQPLFYLVEMTMPYSYLHPIYLPIFVLGLAGLGYMLWRRSHEDKLLLVWFAVIYVFFTFVGTKHWRYVMPVFPVLAIAAANLLVVVYSKLAGIWRATQTPSNKKRLAKIGAGLLMVSTVGSVAASTIDAYTLSAAAPYVALPETVQYVADRLEQNQSIMVICSSNLVNQKATQFYLNAYEQKTNPVLVYPLDPADVYTPDFNANTMLGQCQANNVAYLLLFENRGEPYYNKTLTVHDVVELILNTGQINYEATIGSRPCRLFVFHLNQTLTTP